MPMRLNQVNSATWWRVGLVTTLASLALTSCKEPEDEAPPPLELGDECDPDPAAEVGCTDHLRCEPLVDADTSICAPPFEIHGRVVSAETGSGIEDADVLVFEANNMPTGAVTRTDADGGFATEVVAVRNADGSIAAGNDYTLGAAATDHLPYPSGIRPAIPIAGTDATLLDEDPSRYVLDRSEAPVALIRRAEDERIGVVVTGTVVSDAAAGSLVLADLGNGSHRSAIADETGAYRLFNVPSGTVTVSAYRRFIEFESLTLDVGTSAIDDADLAEIGPATAQVSGNVNIVNASGDSLTSVVLVPSIAFNDALERGPVPWGLRAPDHGLAPDVNGAFTIADVPAGRYKVLAAFENDDLVRDPDTSIAGTEILEIDVASGIPVVLEASFKITQALEVVSPGADGPDTVTEAPDFVFVDDSSEERYEVVLYDALGNTVWRDDTIEGVSGGEYVEVAYRGPALEPGMYYQYRATSWKDKPKESALSRTEDLRGVFVYAP